jgi:hypothetical protein
MLLKAPQTEMRGNILEFEISNRLQKFCEISHCLQLFSGFQASVHALNNLFTLQERHEFSKDEFAEILTTPHPQTLCCGSPTSPLPFYIPCPVRQFSLFYFENRRFQASLHPFAPRHQHSLLKQLNTGGETDTAEPSKNLYGSCDDFYQICGMLFMCSPAQLASGLWFEPQKSRTRGYFSIQIKLVG